MALLVLEHFNKVGRYKQAFPQWLIDLRGWEHSIAHKYLSKQVHVFEVLEHIKDGSYWTRYHQYLREENDEVYYAKWKDGTDWFTHEQTALFWYSPESEVDHWMDLAEYNAKKTNQGDRVSSGGSDDADGVARTSSERRPKGQRVRKSIEDEDIPKELEIMGGLISMLDIADEETSEEPSDCDIDDNQNGCQ